MRWSPPSLTIVTHLFQAAYEESLEITTAAAAAVSMLIGSLPCVPDFKGITLLTNGFFELNSKCW